MRLQIIPFSDVAADVAAIKAARDTSHPSSRSQRFSTAQHHLSEILPVVPENMEFRHESPPWDLYNYTLWLPLIAKSQGMTDHTVVNIPAFLYEDLMRCHGAWVVTGRIYGSLMSDVTETWLATKSGKELTQCLDGKRKWFIRLDQMSPKDSPLGGKDPSSTLQDVITKLCSSMRAYGALYREHEDAKREQRDMEMKLILNPWDEDMDAGKEFRVFVPPPTARRAQPTVENLNIAAISQYRWVTPFQTAHNLSVHDTVDIVHHGAEVVLNDIKAYIKKDLNVAMQQKLVKYGFSFDIGLKSDHGVQMVEVNPFGALSGCGGSLCNWIKDGKAMYGLEEDLVFYITLEDDMKEVEC